MYLFNVYMYVADMLAIILVIKLGQVSTISADISTLCSSSSCESPNTLDWEGERGRKGGGKGEGGKGREKGEGERGGKRGRGERGEYTMDRRRRERTYLSVSSQ